MAGWACLPGTVRLTFPIEGKRISAEPCSSADVQRRLLDILACPIDKHYPLQLIELKAEGDKVISGAILCEKCGRYYPIVDEIPVMLPDELRNKKEDLEFLATWRAQLPPKVVQQGLPHNLS
jgi:uncharacterized protein YbaR (Trm112 family)